MFWDFKLSFVVDILTFFGLGDFLGYFLKKWANFFSNLLFTLMLVLLKWANEIVIYRKKWLRKLERTIY
jgi:hypothetical protein